MYEIWLMLNIVYEMALTVWPWLLVAAIVWLLLLSRAWGSGRAGWRASLPGAVVLALAVATLAFLVVPGQVGSALSEMKYWVDWANLLGIAGAAGAVALAFVWPLMTALARPGRAA